MASLIKRVLKQKAVYWEPAGAGPDGQQTFKDPVQIRCRWEDTNETFLDKNGNTQVSRAVVMTDRDVMLLGILWFGKIEDLTVYDDPLQNDGAYEIRKFDKKPNFKATQFLRMAYL
jgi:hypothetical protein